MRGGNGSGLGRGGRRAAGGLRPGLGRGGGGGGKGAGLGPVTASALLRLPPAPTCAPVLIYFPFIFGIAAPRGSWRGGEPGPGARGEGGWGVEGRVS